MIHFHKIPCLAAAFHIGMLLYFMEKNGIDVIVRQWYTEDKKTKEEAICYELYGYGI